jgi:hypothetical protein
METILSSRKKVSVNWSIKTLTQLELDDTPGWIKDLCDNWLQVISHFRKTGVAYKLYKGKISGLLNVIRPAYLMGVKNWIYQPGKKPEIRWKILTSHIEGIVRLIKILNSSKNQIYTRTLKELESLLTELTDPVFFTPEGVVHQE